MRRLGWIGSLLVVMLLASSEVASAGKCACRVRAPRVRHCCRVLCPKPCVPACSPAPTCCAAAAEAAPAAPAPATAAEVTPAPAAPATPAAERR